MNDQPNTHSTCADPERFSQAVVDLTQRFQRIALGMVEQAGTRDDAADPDPMDMGGLMMKMGQQLWTDPMKLAATQGQLASDSMALWQYTARRWMALPEGEPVVKPESDDRRFKDPLWSELAAFDSLKQSYLLWSRWMTGQVADMSGLSEQEARKARFVTQQVVDTFAPSNFALTNPEVLSEALETGGESLYRGLVNLLDDMENGGAITMTDRSAFTVGENIASTPGKVIFRNELIELIQFAPTTKTVHKRPLLIVPPWINKYYILDLRPKNSMVKWAVEQGHTVFIVSWVNPGKNMANKTFEDYLLHGTMAAIDAALKATGEPDLNLVGYCLGGTLTAATLGYMKAKGDERVKTVSLLTTLTDFEKAGELKVYIDERQLASLEADMEKKGFLEGSKMANSFNFLRANDLVWSFVIHNYLLGKAPFPFDLLYWNADSTRMPKAMHSFYLRRMYVDNALAQPGGMTLGDVAIDLRKVDMPTYLLSTKEDHIAPWIATYQATQLFSGPIRFVLSESGHIAGVVNPPASNKYGYWTGPDSFPADPEAWFEQATHHEHSWWSDWDQWLTKVNPGDKRVPAREPGAGPLPALCDAPGEYVLTQS